MDTNTPDRLNMRLVVMLAALGAFLCLVGWYRFLS
jgi:hypothetical protein